MGFDRARMVITADKKNIEAAKRSKLFVCWTKLQKC